ncbi:MAG: LLM class flavin-dependent oxidoreductase [Thermomicrobiaceae bacterium]|nr:LLM class flavin-dependent oxidoreductase [Thermomicrobiaceae bacterium]
MEARFGIFDIMQVPPGVPSQEAFADHLADVELADGLGLDLYFAAERHFMPYYRTPSPSVWLAAVASRTRRIRLGALAYTVPMHNPVRLAEEVAMLDHLSGGRMEVGIGLGHRPEELASIGVDPQLRQPLLLEGLVLMLRAWRGEPFHHPGQMYRFHDLYVEAPVQRPHPPLWYAGNDPLAVQWAARNGLSVAVGFQPNQALLAPCAVYRTTVQSEGKPDAPNHLALMRHLYVADSDREAREEMTRDLMRIGEAFAASPRQLAGIGERPKRLSRAEAEASAARLVEQDVVVAGSAATVAERVASTMRLLMLDVFLANPYLTGVEEERVRRTLRLYATEVVPRVRELLHEHGRGSASSDSAGSA